MFIFRPKGIRLLTKKLSYMKFPNTLSVDKEIAQKRLFYIDTSVLMNITGMKVLRSSSISQTIIIYCKIIQKTMLQSWFFVLMETFLRLYQYKHQA